MPQLSIVIPMRNEEGNILPLIDEIRAAMQNYDYEVICINDDSTDGTANDISTAQSRSERIKTLKNRRKMGMSASIRSGVKEAAADWILTMDGDGQNDPADVPRLCELAWRGGDRKKRLVAGIRVNRQDTAAKKIASKTANLIRRTLLGDECPDTGCALKMFPKESYKELPFFNGLHRFMPALLKLYGHEIVFTPVNDRPRRHGISKSDYIGRAVKGFFDLFGVLWLICRTPRTYLEE